VLNARNIFAMNRNALLTIILLVIFIGTSILAVLNAKKIVTTTHPYSTTNPDFFMTSATYTKFNTEGNIQNRIETEKITHFTANNTYLFQKPKMVIYNPNEQPWYISANKGESKKGRSTVNLRDNVKIIRAAGANNSDFDITTAMLTIYPDIKFAETEQPVTIIQNGNITKAVGAKSDFKTGIVKLMSKIEALYQIN
jgi:lipopolysaccharide export system protein LptC